MGKINEKLDDAINRDDLDEVKALVSKGADIECVDAFGCTPLMNAAWVASEEIVGFLLGLGADYSHQDNDGKTALDRVLEIGHNRYGHDPIIEILKNIKHKH
tara:strand:+ start:367 stop:672 length:306 start_codon:yes stop_codon:yes gene_type:complete